MSTDDPKLDDESEGFMSRSSLKRSVPFRVFVLTVVCFLAALLALGLGLGLGLPKAPSSSLSRARADEPPNELPIISLGKLTNRTGRGRGAGGRGAGGAGRGGGEGGGAY